VPHILVDASGFKKSQGLRRDCALPGMPSWEEGCGKPGVTRSTSQGGCEDYANAVCGVLRDLSKYFGYSSNYAEWVG
jgi:hypothetical protein